MVSLLQGTVNGLKTVRGLKMYPLTVLVTAVSALSTLSLRYHLIKRRLETTQERS